jgi:SAM-dependent methyltransferase
MHSSSFEKMKKFCEELVQKRASERLRIMDLGSLDINGTYRSLFERKGWQYTGLDLENGPNVDVVLTDPYKWREVGSRTVDVLISGQALEHVEHFWRTMLEVERVLKPGGLCCLIAPSSGFEHRHPVDCWRFYPDGFKALCNFLGFEPLSVYTQWEDRNYPDGSDVWHDTVLIARKPKRPLIKGIKWGLAQYLKRKALAL